MIAPDITISNTLRLIAPNVERDAPRGVQWMHGPDGHETQRLMGIPPQDIHNHTLEEEQELIASFVHGDDELVWMIESDGRVVGVVEVGMNIPPEEHGPSLSIMIGDVSARGKGIGSQAMSAVLHYLQEQGYGEVTARYLVSNSASAKMNEALGFVRVGGAYVDEDGLEWQNVVKRLSGHPGAM